MATSQMYAKEKNLLNTYQETITQNPAPESQAPVLWYIQIRSSDLSAEC